jgi:HK97 family phage prohead protease
MYKPQFIADTRPEMGNLIRKHAQLDEVEQPLDVLLEIKEVAADGTFTGYGAVFGNLDADRDIIHAGAFAKTLKKKTPSKIKLLWQHDPAQPIGVWEAMEEDKRGLKVKGKLLINQGVPKADEAYALLKAGALDAMSIGFAIPKDGAEWDSAKGVRDIKEVDLWEISLVTFPANHRARVTRVKSAVPFQDHPLADRGRQWDSSAAESRVRQWAGGGTSLADMDWGQYRKAFLWYDSDNPEVVTSYKLPVADVINGNLTVIPRGIFAAAGAMLGARGGVALPEGAQSRVISHLERYYSKLDMESPFKALDMGDGVKSYVIALLAGAGDAKEYEQALREVGFSGTEAKAITAKLGPQREVEVEKQVATLQAAINTLSQLTTRTD